MGARSLARDVRTRTAADRSWACTFAQVSLSVSVRLNTSAPGRESGSGVK